MKKSPLNFKPQWDPKDKNLMSHLKRQAPLYRSIYQSLQQQAEKRESDVNPAPLSFCKLLP